MISNDRIDAAMRRVFAARGYDVCDWARCMVEARRSRLPAVRADRLRSAAEFRRLMGAGR